MPDRGVDSRSYLFLDESGTSGISSTQDPHARYLALFGCVVEHPDYVTRVRPAFDELKRSHFPHKAPIVLHRRDILRRAGPFSILRDLEKQTEFDEAILGLFDSLPYVALAVVVDKAAHGRRPGRFYDDPYHFAMALMLERFAGLLERQDRVGNVVVESRGAQDQQLSDIYRRIFLEGTDYHAPEHFQDRLRSRELAYRDKKEPVAGLELADLLAHTAKCDVLADHDLATPHRDNLTADVVKILERKYNRHHWTGLVAGYGKTFFTWPSASKSAYRGRERRQRDRREGG
jgi:hypothetical protein